MTHSKRPTAIYSTTATTAPTATTTTISVDKLMDVRRFGRHSVPCAVVELRGCFVDLLDLRTLSLPLYFLFLPAVLAGLFGDSLPVMALASKPLLFSTSTGAVGRVQASTATRNKRQGISRG